MMRTVRFELLRPSEIIAERDRFPVVFQPIGPLEWHGPHLPYGTDPLHAQAVSVRTAEAIGGVVMPTLYWGSERERSPESLRQIGFKGDEWIVGMDFPDNSMKSLYSMEDVLAFVVRARLELVIEQGYKLIVIVNGHGAANHMATLDRLAKEYTARGGAKVLFTTAFDPSPDGTYNIGHADALETSLMLALEPESVDIPALLPLSEPLKNTGWGIVDGDTFSGRPTPDYTLRPNDDPRLNASAEQGEAALKGDVERLSKQVHSALNG
ncbi:MAG: creatininase family protein [Chloroflexi bacterium]|nr:creatininase family protein [Chloroflexota bacterium]MCC6893230.1 creatininase family protein [Anaerolineae bacterium]